MLSSVFGCHFGFAKRQGLGEVKEVGKGLTPTPLITSFDLPLQRARSSPDMPALQAAKSTIVCGN